MYISFIINVYQFHNKQPTEIVYIDRGIYKKIAMQMHGNTDFVLALSVGYYYSEDDPY